MEGSFALKFHSFILFELSWSQRDKEITRVNAPNVVIDDSPECIRVIDIVVSLVEGIGIVMDTLFVHPAVYSLCC